LDCVWKAREYEKEMAAKTHAYHTNKIVQTQNNERLKNKQNNEKARVAKRNNFWEKMEMEADVQARKDAEDWLLTEEGKECVEKEAMWIYEEDPKDAAKRAFEGRFVKKCDWSLLQDGFGGKYAQAFFFNQLTGQKVMCEELTKKDCTEIARSTLIAARANAMRDEVSKRATADDEKNAREVAVNQIIMKFRSRKCLRMVREMLRRSYVKRIHEVTGDLFFCNVRTGEGQSCKPLILGSSDGIQYENASDWECRVDPDSEFNTHPPTLGAFYYIHKTSGETSWYPPPSFITCFQCRARFVTRKNNDTGHRYCIDCYIENMKYEGGKPEDWTKIPVQASKCIVCKSKFSTIICYKCHGDPYCDDCAALVHNHPTRYEYW
jgi:hypothetical protein